LRDTLSQAISASRTQPVDPIVLAAAAPPSKSATAPAATSRRTPEPARLQAIAANPTPSRPAPTSPVQLPEAPLHDNEETQPALLVIDELATEAAEEPPESRRQTVTSVVMSGDTVEETQESLALTTATLDVNDVGVVVFTIDSDFATTAIRAVSLNRNFVLATSFAKVAQAVAQQHMGVLVTDFTTNKSTLQKIIGVLKKNMPELVTVVASTGRDTTDMINLINYGQIFRYILKPIEPEQLRKEIQAAANRHLYLLNNPESAKRHGVLDSPNGGETSKSINQFIGDIRDRRSGRIDRGDTFG